MIAHRAKLESSNPFTTVQPADRIPSHGTQTSMDGTADLSRGPSRPLFGRPMPAPDRAAPLNLWDTSADSIPETWSTPR